MTDGSGLLPEAKPPKIGLCLSEESEDVPGMDMPVVDLTNPRL